MSTRLDTLCWLLDKARACGATAADAVLFHTTDVNTTRRLGKPEGLERSENTALGLRCFVDDRQAIVSSTDLGKQALGDLAQRAVEMARITPADKDSVLAPPALQATTVTELDLCDDNEPPPQWFDTQCAAAEEAAMSVTGITNSEGADASFSRSQICLATANDKVTFAQSYATSHFSVSLSVLAGSGTAMERDYDFSSAHHREDLLSAETIGNNAAQRTLKKLQPRKVSSCNVPVLFDPRVSRQLLSILAGSISGSAVARGASFLKDAMDKDVFNTQVTIVDDPHIKRGLGSKPFDAEGVKNQKRTMVDRGTLKSWLLDIRTANKLGLTTTGHATRSVTSPPSPSSTNLYMQAGTLSPQALMSDIKSGLYLTDTFGMGVNTVTGDYSQGASGFWIERGEIAYPVSEITIAGNLRDMFAKLTPADDLEFRYATNAPTVRIDHMTVAGT